MKPQTTPKPFRQPPILDSYEKGRFFEEYVIQLFNADNFKLNKWRKSEKLGNSILLQDCANPDLELIFGKYRKYHFAVECKWREKFIENKITWATNNQISSYQNFEKKFRIPVFIAIGIGGEPSSPESLFVTPLCNMAMYSEVYEADLIPYKRKPTSRFFYDTVQLKLF
jgi:hypothetical protein